MKDLSDKALAYKLGVSQKIAKESEETKEENDLHLIYPIPILKPPPKSLFVNEENDKEDTVGVVTPLLMTRRFPLLRSTLSAGWRR